MSNRYLGGFISATLNPLLQPSAPIIGTATAGNASASITFTASTTGSPTSYTVVSSPQGITGTGTTSPITISGLTNGTTYTFVVFANNQYGPSAASAASNSATPNTLPTFILQLDAANWNGTTWTATVGANPVKNGTISASTTNGYPCALFGSNGYFTIPSFVAPSSLSVFAVLNEVSAPLIVEQSTNANEQNGFYYYTDNGYPYAVFRSSVGTILAFNPAAGEWFPAGFAMGATNFNGSTFTLRRNSTDIAASAVIGSIASYATSSNTTDTLHIGSRAGNSLFFNGGSLCELIIAQGLSSTDFNTVTNYLTTKYGL